MIKLITIFIILFMTLTSPKTNNEIDPGFGGIDCGDDPNLGLKWIEKESKDIKYRKEAIFNKFGRSEKYIVIENDNNVYHIAYSRFFAIPFEHFNYYIDELYEGIKIENKDQFEEESINEFWNKYEFVIGGIKIRDSYKVYQNSDDLLKDLITEQIDNPSYYSTSTVG